MIFTRNSSSDCRFFFSLLPFSCRNRDNSNYTALPLCLSLTLSFLFFLFWRCSHHSVNEEFLCERERRCWFGSAEFAVGFNSLFSFVMDGLNCQRQSIYTLRYDLEMHASWTKKEKHTYITFRVHLHFRHHIVILHVLLADVPTVLDGLDPFPDVVRLDHSPVYGGLGDEHDGRTGEGGLKNGKGNESIGLQHL